MVNWFNFRVSLWRSNNFVNIRQQLVIDRRILDSFLIPLVKSPKLNPTYGSVHRVKPRSESNHVMLALGFPPTVSEFSSLFRRFLIVGDDHSSVSTDGHV